MEACSENGIPLIILDRPNPNTHFTDGPVLEDDCKSFVGMHPVPIVPGMTIGEYAKMINGEKWLADKIQCDLTVIPIRNYTHQTPYQIPLRPSPNLPNAQSIALYPSLCLLEPHSHQCWKRNRNAIPSVRASQTNANKLFFCPSTQLWSQKPKA